MTAKKATAAKKAAPKKAPAKRPAKKAAGKSVTRRRRTGPNPATGMAWDDPAAEVTYPYNLDGPREPYRW